MAGKDVFISYKAEDFDEANWVRSTLENNGISCWMAPSSIPGGSSYATEITNAIRGCKFFVLVLSEKAQHSKWVPKEVDQAINEGKTILPFMLENCSLKDDFNFYLTNVQRYTAYENKAKAIEKMITEIKAMMGAGTISPSPDGGAAEKIVVGKYKPAKKKTESLAIVSFVLALLSIPVFGLFLVTNIAAIICAVIAVKNMGVKGTVGVGLAMAGLIIGLATSAIALIYMLQVVGAVILIIGMIISICAFVKYKKKI